MVVPCRIAGADFDGVIVEPFDIPDGVNVRGLEQLAYVRVARLFWRMAHDIACEAAPLPELPICWSGRRSTRQMYADMCDIPGDVAIRTGDYVLSDSDGVVVLPQDKASDIVAETERVMATENQVRKAILDGMDPQQAYLTYRKF